MGQHWDPADEGINPDKSVLILMDVMAELDEDEESFPVTEQALAEAEARAFGVFAQAARDQAAESELEAEVDVSADWIAELTILEIEDWLTQVPVDAVRLRGPVAVATTERDVPALLQLGFAAQVDVDADVDADNCTADLAVQLTTLVPDRAALTVVVLDGQGQERRARVNTFGLAEVQGVRLAPGTPLVIRLVRGAGA